MCRLRATIARGQLQKQAGKNVRVRLFSFSVIAWRTRPTRKTDPLLCTTHPLSGSLYDMAYAQRVSCARPGLAGSTSIGHIPSTHIYARCCLVPAECPCACLFDSILHWPSLNRIRNMSASVEWQRRYWWLWVCIYFVASNFHEARLSHKRTGSERPTDRETALCCTARRRQLLFLFRQAANELQHLSNLIAVIISSGIRIKSSTSIICDRRCNECKLSCSRAWASWAKMQHNKFANNNI